MLQNELTIKRLKREIIEATIKSGEGHIPSAFSIMDILWILYKNIMDISPENFQEINRDHFILSKGHGSLALYAMLAELNFFDRAELGNFAQFDSILGGHPDCNKIPGVETSTGSLGHGMPMAVGMALGLKIKKFNKRVFVLVGDGECNEGAIWESALLAAHHNLNNLTCIIDYNHSTDRALLLGDLSEKFSAFGWHSRLINGHDHSEIKEALEYKPADKPNVIIANTIKGYGVKMMENNPAWHHKPPTNEELKTIFEDLN